MQDKPHPLVSQLGQQGWYPDDSEELIKVLTKDIDIASKDRSYDTKAIICPHAGYTYCGEVFAKGIQTIQNNSYTKAIIIGPSHYMAIKDQAILTTYTGIQTPLGTQFIDQGSIDQLKGNSYFETNSCKESYAQ